MPLDRAHITAASRITLRLYPAFFGTIGTGLLLTPLDRLIATPAFRYADAVLSIRLWGLGFLTLALVFVVALHLKNRATYKQALGAAVGWMTVWAIVTALSAIEDRSSFTAWAWPAFVAGCCWASLVSLETREHS